MIRPLPSAISIQCKIRLNHPLGGLQNLAGGVVIAGAIVSIATVSGIKAFQIFMKR